MNRREVYENNFSAKALFLTGLIIMPALLFNPDTGYRVIQFLFFLLLAFFSGKKINALLTFIVILLIIIFNLSVPYGYILYAIGPLRITSGALDAGIHRAFTFQALVMLSKVSVRNDLKISGSFGELLAESLRIFSVLMNRINLKPAMEISPKRAFFFKTRKNIITEIDNLLLELSGEEIQEPSVIEKKTKTTGFIILISAAAFSWFLMFMGMFYGFR